MTPAEKRELDRLRASAVLYAAWRRSLPDARPVRLHQTYRSYIGPVERCYCVHCGRPGGYASERSQGLERIVYQCTECAHRHGFLPLPILAEGD